MESQIIKISMMNFGAIIAHRFQFCQDLIRHLK